MKVPEPKRLKSGNWRVRLTIGGEVLSITRATKEECRSEARTIKSDYLAGRREALSREVKDKTLEEVQTDYVNKNRPVLSPATQRSYESYIRNRWAGYRGKRLCDIKWQEMINAELGKVAEKTVKNAWGLVTPALTAAGYPVPSVKLAAVPVKELAFLQPDEIVKFVDTAKGRRYETAVLLMLHGLRLSEVKGLRWRDVDLDRGILTVRGAEVRGPDGLVRKDTNKNETSTRAVPVLIPRLLGVLTEEAEKREAEARKRKEAAKKQGTDAQKKEEKPDPDPDEQIVKTNPSNLLEDVKRCCRDAGVTEVTCHGLRRSFASLGYYADVPERQIMAWGGWKDFQTMHRVYIKLAAIGEQKSKKKMTEAFQPKKAKHRYKLLKGGLKPKEKNDTKNDTDVKKARK